MNTCLECGEETNRPKFCNNKHGWDYHRKIRAEERKPHRNSRLRKWYKKTYEERKVHINEWRKKRRHETGISKKYKDEFVKKEKKKHRYPRTDKQREAHKKWKQTEKGRLSQKKHNLIHRSKTIDLDVKVIQLVYEDNIKKYGTLTCYLCELPVSFGKDHLEHKIPLSRGGDNSYINLEVSCGSCNCKKGTKTVEEYKQYKLERN